MRPEGETGRKRMQFWGANDDDDHLVREVLRGEKTATVCKADTYALPEGAYDTGDWQVGDLVDVYDLHGVRRCVIEITEVTNVRFGDVPERLWRGEACRDAEHFREAHRLCWPEYDLTPEFEMTATYFRLVEVMR